VGPHGHWDQIAVGDTDINDIVDSLIESIQAASWDGKASMCGFDLEIALLGFVSSGYGKGMMLN
jgi:hypothetical protein